ncbi:MAG: enoyl-CoA hydratase-related protein [Ignavibacteriales bacterium]|nr:enoyl-CoA hydratase-related protein [Ignavibacteriales bacterium]
MDYKSIKYSVEQKIALIKLNRPEVLNSFNKEMAKEFQEALIRSRDFKEVHTILITGEGKAFCAGQDLSETVPRDKPMADVGELVRESYNPIIMLLREIEKPIVCSVNGTAAGAGANIALACDITVASEKAIFIQAFSKIGLIPDSGGTFFLPRLVGLQKASAMMMLAEKISAEDALKYGMIYKTFPGDQLFEESFKIAKHLSTLPAKGLGLTKRALNKSLHNDLASQLKLEEELQIEASHTYDYQEGVKAFLEKRNPDFRGE